MGEIRNNKENLWAINIESEIKDLRVNVLEEEEEEGDTGDERVEGKFYLIKPMMDSGRILILRISF